MFFGPVPVPVLLPVFVADILNIVAVLKTGLVKLNQRRHSIRFWLVHYVAPMEELVTRFYARFLTHHPGVIGKLVPVLATTELA